jgi:hypothetical protein
VEYSTILETITSDLVETQNVALDDADELHLGVEVVLLGSTPLFALRGGVWLDPDHRIRNMGPEIIDNALFLSGEDVVHATLGFGVAFTSFQLDLGVDLSEYVDTAALSVIFSF